MNLEIEDILTKRELGVLELLALGMTVKEIGHELHLSQKTVEYHRRNIYNRLEIECGNIVMLAHIAIARGIVPILDKDLINPRRNQILFRIPAVPSNVIKYENHAPQPQTSAIRRMQNDQSDQALCGD